MARPLPSALWEAWSGCHLSRLDRTLGRSPKPREQTRRRCVAAVSIFPTDDGFDSEDFGSLFACQGSRMPTAEAAINLEDAKGGAIPRSRNSPRTAIEPVSVFATRGTRRKRPVSRRWHFQASGSRHRAVYFRRVSPFVHVGRAVGGT